MLTESDRKTLQARGITEEQLQEQVNRFVTGFPYLKIYDSARPGEGITVLSDSEQTEAVERWKRYLADGGKVTKFVPASGAASRMFKALFAFVDGAEEHAAEGSDVKKLLDGIHHVAFFKELNEVLLSKYGKDVDALLEVLAKEQPNIPRLSAAGEAEIARQKAEKAPGSPINDLPKEVCDFIAKTASGDVQRPPPVGAFLSS